MSVLIKGMEMPKSCARCKLFGEYGCPFIGAVGYALTRGERNEDCPLVPVPPHGRLIDEQWLKDAMIATLEALKKNPKMDKQEMHLIAAFDTLRVMVEDAPTVIEEEGGE